MRATNPFLFRDEGTWFSRLRFKWLVTCRVGYMLHMHASDYDCFEFQDEIPFKEGRMLDPRNSNFWNKGKIVILITKLLISVKNL